MTEVLHDFKCTKCGEVFEQLVDPELVTVYCPNCSAIATKTFERWRKGGSLPKFPEGDWHGLPEIDGRPPEVRSKRQLRELLKKKAKDEFTESYALYDDGYGGY